MAEGTVWQNMEIDFECIRTWESEREYTGIGDGDATVGHRREISTRSVEQNDAISSEQIEQHHTAFAVEQSCE